MVYDFMNSLQCVRKEEESDYHAILNVWKQKNRNIAFMPAIDWNGGTYNLFDQKAKAKGENIIWLLPGGQADFFWLYALKETLVKFYNTDEIDISNHSSFPGIEAEKLEECILLHAEDLQNNPEHTILGANVVLIRLTLSSGREALLFILLDHQDHCWKKIIEDYQISLDWFVDSGCGTEDDYTQTNLYQLMKQTLFPELLPPLYFKGRNNKGEIPEDFHFRYAMLSEADETGYDIWNTFSAVFDTGWNR